jgi:TetR/AcrR family tetracycline transcriptional repressor
MPLQRETVVRAALRIVDNVGLERLTMRRLATELKIQNPSLYWHFNSKQELLDSMAEVIVVDALVDLSPPLSGQDWADWITGYARLLWRMALSHHDGARILAEADLSKSPFSKGLALAVGVLRDAGFDERQAFVFIVTVLNYVLGGAFEFQADASRNPLPTSQAAAPLRRPVLDFERYPFLPIIANETQLQDNSLDGLFEDGLSLLLDGMRMALAPGRPNER